MPNFPSIFKYLLVSYVYEYVYMSKLIYMHMSTGDLGGHKKLTDP